MGVNQRLRSMSESSNGNIMLAELELPSTLTWFPHKRTTERNMGRQHPLYTKRLQCIWRHCIFCNRFLFIFCIKIKRVKRKV